MKRTAAAVLLFLTAATSALAQEPAGAPPQVMGMDPAVVDAEIARAMVDSGARGLAMAVIHNGEVVYAKAHGVRNAAGAPLTADTVMYGASLTKAVFGYTVAQLAQEGRVGLDRSIADDLPRPLPDYPRAETERLYGPYADLAGDERWRRLTPRILLNHGSGFGNFAFLEPDGKLRFHFEPGTRYAYSGEGLILLQFVLEKGLGLDVGAEMQRRVFDRFGMSRTSMTWRPDFARNLADGFDAEGRPQPHDERSRVRAAGSMDTTLNDMARFAAAYVRGEGLTHAMAQEIYRPQLPITTASQFPTLQPELPPGQRRPDLAAGLGVVTFDSPFRRSLFKGGHDEITANTMVCVPYTWSCVVILSNDVRAEAAFPRLVRLILPHANVPWSWEYGNMRFLP